MDETGIGRAVNIHRQTVEGFTLPGDTSETRRYFVEDITDPPVVRNSVSHAHNVNRRMFKPNLRNIKLDVDGVKKSVKVCMKCLKTLSKV